MQDKTKQKDRRTQESCNLDTNPSGRDPALTCKMEKLSAIKHTHICGVVQIIASFYLIGSLLADSKLQAQALSFPKI